MDISSTIYKFITAVDKVICVAVFPIGISFFSERAPGFFENAFTCASWMYIWMLAQRLSVFLVICLCSTRTFCLLKPFYRLKIRHVSLIISIFFLLQLAQILGLHMVKEVSLLYFRANACCKFYLDGDLAHDSSARMISFLSVSMILTYVIPAFVVAICCVISFIVLTKQQTECRPRRYQRHRNRATTTILLFSILYEVCNVPDVVRLIVLTHAALGPGMQYYHDFFEFDMPQEYFLNFTWTLSIVANSALNPLLYFWRMRRLRESISSDIARIRRFVSEQMLRRNAVDSQPPQDFELNRIGVPRQKTS